MCKVIYFLSGSDGPPDKKKKQHSKGGGTLLRYRCLWNVWGGKAKNALLKRHHVYICVRSRDISLKYYPKERWSTKRSWFGQSSKGGIVTWVFLGEARILILTIIKLLTPRGPIKLGVNFIVYRTTGSLSLPSRDFYDHLKPKFSKTGVNRFKHMPL